MQVLRERNKKRGTMEHISSEGVTYNATEFYQTMFEDEGDLSEFILPEDSFLDSKGSYVYDSFEWE